MPDEAIGQQDPKSIPGYAWYVDDIRQMQSDALLLLKFISGRSDRTVAPKDWKDLRSSGRARTGEEDPNNRHDGFLVEISQILSMTAEDVAKKPEYCGFLFGAIDYLACLAKPATIETIKLTRAYIGADPLQPLPTGKLGSRVTQNAKVLRRSMLATGLVCGIFLLLAVMLMSHVVSGQKTIQALKQEREEQARLVDQMNVLSQVSHNLGPRSPQPNPGRTASHQPTDSGVEYSGSSERPAPSQPEAGAMSADCRVLVDAGLGNLRVTPDLCFRYEDLNLRMGLTYLELAVWNGASDSFYKLFPIPGWVRPTIELPPPDNSKSEQSKLTRDRWETTELRTEQMLLGLSAYGIPVLLGVLGATAYVFRDFTAKLDANTIEPRDAYKSILRLTLGMMLGGLIAIVFEDTGAGFHGMKLSLWALAFLVGYAVPIVFGALDWIVETASGALRKKGDPPDAPRPALGEARGTPG